jgi:3-hydroxybutyryl-CoA dehydrogenase
VRLEGIRRVPIGGAGTKGSRVEDLERSWMGVTQMPTGPFPVLDLAGLEIVWHIADYCTRRTDVAQARADVDCVREFVD